MLLAMSSVRAAALPIHHRVAAEVRASLARANVSGRQAAMQLGWKQQYISRRLNGTVPFDVVDLYALAELLDIPVEGFFPPRPASPQETVPSSTVVLRRITASSLSVLSSAA
jgi:transcriptional regulator with XRE-family HTH domain